MYGTMISQMNTSLANLQESNLQAATEKKVNRPSDDPAGMANILAFRASLDNINDYYKNTSVAKGWLNLTDGVLQQTSSLITRASELAEQIATGTVSAENRDQVASELRQVYQQLITLGNTQYAGQYIFGGQKTNAAPYASALGVTSNDPAMQGVNFAVQGSSNSTIVVQFLSNGTIGADALDFRYSSDGGKNWTTSTLPAGATTLNIGGVDVDVHPAAGVPTVTAVDPDNLHENNNGTWLYIRPTARYLGDDNDAIEVQNYGAAGVNAVANGAFSSNVAVRIDQAATLGGGGTILYSYSTDGGTTWVSGNTASEDEGRLLVPGGYLNLTGGPALAAGDQFIIHPRRANINLEISQGQNLTINSIGKDIFGGVYQSPSDTYPIPVFGGDDRNLFEVIGKLIGYAETNNQQGCQECLAALTESHKSVMTVDASVGGRLNRVAVAQQTLANVADSETQGLSNIEDVDYIELMTRMAQQELIYQSVLKSSSMLMQLSLLNYV